MASLWTRPPLQHTHPSQRQWHQSLVVDGQEGAVFRLMSYNILADSLALRHRRELYRSTPMSFLDWTYRWNRLLDEIGHRNPDVLCLQEVDHYEQIEADLSQLGYLGAYLKRSGACLDGCATFWSEIELYFDGRDWNEVQPDSATQSTGSRYEKNYSLIVANTHILFNPKRGDIKLAQVRILTDEVSRLSRLDYPNCFPAACVVAGDFNSSPESGVYKFMTQGFVNLTKYTCKDLSGGIRGSFGRPPMTKSRTQNNTPSFQNGYLPPWHPSPSDDEIVVCPTDETCQEPRCRSWWPEQTICDERGLTERSEESSASFLFRRRSSDVYNLGWTRQNTTVSARSRSHYRLIQRFPRMSTWKPEQLETVTGLSLPQLLDLANQQRQPFVLDHDLHLSSAYYSVLGQEPEATSLHDNTENTMDYVFYSPYAHRFTNSRHQFVRLRPVAALKLPAVNGNDPKMKMPNEWQGSDHFSMCVEFVCEWTDDYKEAGLPLPPPTRAIERIYQQRPCVRRGGYRRTRPRNHSRSPSVHHKRRHKEPVATKTPDEH